MSRPEKHCGAAGANSAGNKGLGYLVLDRSDRRDWVEVGEAPTDRVGGASAPTRRAIISTATDRGGAC